MDFRALDSRSAATKGAWLHLRHPVTNELLYDLDAKGKQDKSKPCRVLVMGTESSEAQRMMTDLRRARAKAEKATGEKATEEEELASFEALHTAMVETVRHLILGYDNVNNGEVPASAPVDNEWFLNLQLITSEPTQRAFVQQVAEFSSSRANYLGNAQPS